MHDRFVPASYKRDLRKKLEHLYQGDMSVQDFYAELQKGMIRYTCRERIAGTTTTISAEQEHLHAQDFHSTSR
jgi:hypothetical protein